jgi:tRNA-splicing ligase RtcB
MSKVIEIFKTQIPECSKTDAKFGEVIDVPHNYARIEHHFGENVMVHRKGAIAAKLGVTGIIPGSQGTSSFIVRGKGEVESFMSCSHGAGRKMGRQEARRVLDIDAETKRLDDRGVLHSIRSKEDLDEAPGAYKDIHRVMTSQLDLVELIVELKPLAVIKG